MAKISKADLNLFKFFGSLKIFSQQQWTDVNLRWNPEDYGGIETLRISTDRIWIPDVLMYNR